MTFSNAAISRQLWSAILVFVFFQWVPVSCTRPATDQGPVIPVADNQAFMLTGSVTKENFDKLQQTVQKDLLPILGGNKNIKSLKVFDSPSSDGNHRFFALIELSKAKASGIVVNASGKVVKLDFSKFISPDSRNTDSFKNLMSLQDLVKDFELKICSVQPALEINRQAMGFLKVQ